MEHAEFIRLASKLRTRAMAIGQSFFGQEESAEDVAQETLIRLWKAWDELGSAEEADRLAVRVAKHECINIWRREQRRPHTSLTISHGEEVAYCQEVDTLEESELAEALRQAAHTLPRAEERLWRMFAEAGMAAAEISAVTEINVRSISTMLSHARNQIYNALKEGGYIDG